MEAFQHFGHEHTLAFYQDENQHPQPYFCNICTLPILSSPSYICTKSTCKYFLHKSCAHLPTKLEHQLNLPVGRSTIYVLREKGPDIPHCEICQKLCHGFTYFSDDYNHYNLHPLCAKPVEIKSKHKGHNEHPLVAIYKEISCKCDACGHKHEGFFFSCQECNFWIYQDCTLLPRIVKPASHRHPVVLEYGRNDVYFICYYDCGICGEKVRSKGFYFCVPCGKANHISCAIPVMKNLTSEERKIIVPLPDEGDTFPSSTIRMLANEDDDKKKMTLIEKYHNHPLILHDQDDHDQEELTVCNACIQPIISSTSSPFRECPQPNCHFLLHNFCKNIPSSIHQGFDNLSRPILRTYTTKDFFFSIFICNLCRRLCNGFTYEYWDGSILSDLHCVSTPNTITHTSHGQHVLFSEIQSPIAPYNCCSDGSWTIRGYTCFSCRFHIHVGCAHLPKKVRHKFDKHDLELTFGMDPKLECCFCEFCEEDIDQRYWFYRCGECDHSFHVKCIPSVGLLSKVKFGGTLKVSCHPDHPVALTRMLMEINHRCGYCKDVIKGYVDEMAFRCFECDFWIHFSCARECSSDDRSRRADLWNESLNYSLME